MPKSIPLQSLTRDMVSQDWITLILILCLSLAAVAKTMNAYRFQEFAQLFMSDKYLMVAFKDYRPNQPFQVILFIVQLLSISLFTFLIIKSFFSVESRSPVALYLQIFAFYGILVLGKYYFEKIVASLFSIEDYFEQYHFFKVSYRNYFGLWLIPINALLVYVGFPSRTWMLLILGFLTILHLTTVLYMWKRFQNVILANPFYFILYLCALEIAPYLILYGLLFHG